jgi:hypothetical protein
MCVDWFQSLVPVIESNIFPSLTLQFGWMEINSCSL